MLTPITLSASAVAAYKRCPTQYFLSYVRKLEHIEEPQHFRFGTAWHAALEVYSKAGVDAAKQAVWDSYAVPPPTNVTWETWAVEREMLLAMLDGYAARWFGQEYPTVETELRFELPLRSPRSRMMLPIAEVKRKGFIDRIVAHPAGLRRIEQKTTSRDIGPDSDYFDHLRLDTQVSFYALAARDMGHDDAGTLYDVARKPGIRQKKLSQADTKKFLSSGNYCGHEFTVDVQVEDSRTTAKVNDEPAEITDLKSGGMALRETPQMLGTRMYREIMDNLDKYFRRREIARNDSDLMRHEKELYGMYLDIRSRLEDGCWAQNERACDQPFRCDFTKLCWSGDDPETAVPVEMRVRGERV